MSGWIDENKPDEEQDEDYEDSNELFQRFLTPPNLSNDDEYLKVVYDMDNNTDLPDNIVGFPEPEDGGSSDYEIGFIPDKSLYPFPREEEGGDPGANINPPDPVPDDILSFDRIQLVKRTIFMERREKYGSHLDNAKRFPLEHINGLYLKCTRIIRMVESHANIDEDTLLDLSNYADLILSSKEDE